MKKVFFDTEFTGLKKDAELISIACVSEFMEEIFYAEITDFDYDSVKDDSFIMNEVLGNLLLKDIAENKSLYKEIDFSKHLFVKGTKDFVRDMLNQWLKSLSAGEEIQLYSDVCHYDMVLFIDLFGSAFDMPEFVVPSCHDINQDIAKYYGVTEKEAFDMSREEIIREYKCKFAKKHNALHDAEVIAKINHKLNT